MFIPHDSNKGAVKVKIKKKKKTKKKRNKKQAMSLLFKLVHRDPNLCKRKALETRFETGPNWPP